MKNGVTTSLIVVGCLLLIWVFIIAFKNKVKARVNHEKAETAHYKCAIHECEIIININKTKSKYCAFHDMVSKHHKIFIKEKDPMKHKTEMYLHSNGNIFINHNVFNKIEKDLKTESNKYKK